MAAQSDYYEKDRARLHEACRPPLRLKSLFLLASNEQTNAELLPPFP